MAGVRGAVTNRDRAEPRSRGDAAWAPRPASTATTHSRKTTRDHAGETAVVAQSRPLSAPQQWMVRHRRGVRIGCAVFLAVLVVSAVYDFAEHDVFAGVVSVLVCGSPLSMIWITRLLERTAAVQAGRRAELDRP